jgi:hypothetical protein
MPQALSASRAGDAYPFRAAVIRFAQEIRVRPEQCRAEDDRRQRRRCSAQ